MLSFIIAATLIAATAAQACNYSSICANHTMCQYPTTNYGPNCLAPVYSGVNATTQQQIVDLHNNLRRKVAQGNETRGNPGPQPSAANMREFEWDDELATIAQRWANQCIFQHDTCRNVARFYVGQNLYMSLTTGTPNSIQNWTAAVQAWYDEVQNFNKSHINPFQHKMLSFIIAATLIAATAAQACNYSSICPDHTMCLYPTPDYGPECLTPVCSGVNATTQQQIVDLHNMWRWTAAQGDVYGNPGPQPPAANMRQFEWDDELAMVAQRWANQCIFSHDTCRNVARFNVGQNIYKPGEWNTDPNCGQNWYGAMKDWYYEVMNFNNSDIDPFQFNSATSNYTQLVWADTYLVGCGFTEFSDNDGTWYRALYVCNYGPGGNIAGGSMYKIGPACSQCPAGTTCDNGLCA